MKTKFYPLAILVVFIGLIATVILPGCGSADTAAKSDSTVNVKPDCTKMLSVPRDSIKPRDTLGRYMKNNEIPHSQVKASKAPIERARVKKH
jgi:hypothetical protein